MSSDSGTCWSSVNIIRLSEWMNVSVESWSAFQRSVHGKQSVNICWMLLNKSGNRSGFSSYSMAVYKPYSSTLSQHTVDVLSLSGTWGSCEHSLHPASPGLLGHFDRRGVGCPAKQRIEVVWGTIQSANWLSEILVDNCLSSWLALAGQTGLSVKPALVTRTQQSNCVYSKPAAR